jgi:hypothetical protein
MYKKIIVIGAIVSLIGCNSSKSVIVTSKDRNSKSTKENSSQKKGGKFEENRSTSKTMSTSDVVKGYVLDYKDIAMSNMKNFGIPASIILAQGILESGAGQSKLATTSNNHFGIKCYTDWKGETVRNVSENIKTPKNPIKTTPTLSQKENDMPYYSICPKEIINLGPKVLKMQVMQPTRIIHKNL